VLWRHRTRPDAVYHFTTDFCYVRITCARSTDSPGASVLGLLDFDVADVEFVGCTHHPATAAPIAIRKWLLNARSQTRRSCHTPFSNPDLMARCYPAIRVQWHYTSAMFSVLATIVVIISFSMSPRPLAGGDPGSGGNPDR